LTKGVDARAAWNARHTIKIQPHMLSKVNFTWAQHTLSKVNTTWARPSMRQPGGLTKGRCAVDARAAWNARERIFMVRRPERARNEGSTESKRLHHTRCTTHQRRIKFRQLNTHCQTSTPHGPIQVSTREVNEAACRLDKGRGRQRRLKVNPRS